MLAGLVFLALSAAACVLVFGTWRFTRLSHALDAEVARAPAPRDVSEALPGPVRAFARRSGADPGALAHRVTLSQAAELRLAKGGAWAPLKARQEIATGAVAFAWHAAVPLVGPFPKFTVLDAFAGGRGRLQARLLGAIRVADAAGPDLDRGEAMRYLAEIAWAPDAILGNPDLAWAVAEGGSAEVTTRLPDGPAMVRLIFDEAGDIAEIRASGRPSRDASGKTVLRDWRGNFTDYREIGGRRIPSAAEVGYIYDDGYEAYWRGRITGYELHS